MRSRPQLGGLSCVPSASGAGSTATAPSGSTPSTPGEDRTRRTWSAVSGAAKPENALTYVWTGCAPTRSAALAEAEGDAARTM